MPRGREGDVVYVETPPQFIWHYANASEDPVSGTCQALRANFGTVITLDRCRGSCIARIIVARSGCR